MTTATIMTTSTSESSTEGYDPTIADGTAAAPVQLVTSERGNAPVSLSTSTQTPKASAKCVSSLPTHPRKDSPLRLSSRTIVPLAPVTDLGVRVIAAQPSVLPSHPAVVSRTTEIPVQLLGVSDESQQSSALATVEEIREMRLFSIQGGRHPPPTSDACCIS
jgi:hypothetical protein